MLSLFHHLSLLGNLLVVLLKIISSVSFLMLQLSTFFSINSPQVLFHLPSSGLLGYSGLCSIPSLLIEQSLSLSLGLSLSGLSLLESVMLLLVLDFLVDLDWVSIVSNICFCLRLSSVDLPPAVVFN